MLTHKIKGKNNTSVYTMTCGKHCGVDTSCEITDQTRKQLSCRKTLADKKL